MSRNIAKMYAPFFVHVKSVKNNYFQRQRLEEKNKVEPFVPRNSMLTQNVNTIYSPFKQLILFILIAPDLINLERTHAMFHPTTYNTS